MWTVPTAGVCFPMKRFPATLTTPPLNGASTAAPRSPTMTSPRNPDPAVPRVRMLLLKPPFWIGARPATESVHTSIWKKAMSSHPLMRKAPPPLTCILAEPESASVVWRVESAHTSWLV